MKLLVTGGAGFLGSHFVRAVLADEMPGLEGARVTVLDKLTYAGNFANLGPVAENDRLDFVPGDVADAPLVDSVLRGHDAVAHLAAESQPASESATVVGTQVLLDAALRHGTGRFLVVSTHQVYGPAGSAPWAEGAAVAPGSPYAAAKAGADLLALAYHRTHGLAVVVTRGADTYGPYQHPEKLIPGLVTGLLSGRPVPVPGDGGPVRQWLHADDHCRALALALTRGTPGGVYHVGGEAELPDRELTSRLPALCAAGDDRAEHVAHRPLDDKAEQAGDGGHDDAAEHAADRAHDQAEHATDRDHDDQGDHAADRPGIDRAEPPADRDGDGRRFALDDARIRAELGWEPRVGLDDGLAATVRWYRDNPAWWRPLLTT